eukprot:TRINITY_DN82264_c1_g1_i1.p1 TRINITY_DN82264_c1_g1~~TRINITY_DN82264_c1_g1_i1.p1  ORF type:complete len:145 (-),score=23.14 TRINITY_DN82264_c1_g1_i1:106-540(-)
MHEEDTLSQAAKKRKSPEEWARQKEEERMVEKNLILQALKSLPTLTITPLETKQLGLEEEPSTHKVRRLFLCSVRLQTSIGEKKLDITREGIFCEYFHLPVKSFAMEKSSREMAYFEAVKNCLEIVFGRPITADVVRKAEESAK